MRTCGFSCGLGLLLCAAVPGVLAAEPVEPSPAPRPAAVSAAPVQTAATVAYVDGFGRGVTSAALATSRGGTEVTERMNVNGVVENNSADHLTTGSNAIGNGAFNGAAGIPMAIQNSGNNVLIQNATIVNVQFQP